MFIAHQDNYIPAIFEGEMFFSRLELPAFTPWFICDVPQFEEDSDESFFTTTYLFGDLDKLSQFASSNKIEKTFLISPGYMNKTEHWSMMKLKSVAQAIYKFDGHQGQIFRFELEDGVFLEEDLSGIAHDRSTLVFTTILKFD